LSLLLRPINTKMFRQFRVSVESLSDEAASGASGDSKLTFPTSRLAPGRPIAAAVPVRSSDLRARERVDLLTEPARVGQAVFPLRELQRALEGLARLVDPAGTLEHGGEVLVTPPLEP
jgi:hypothetical protein